MTATNLIRNVAIIAHVDHGKTTLVDQLFKQSGLFRDNQDVAERLMDSMDQERERGITIASKNGAFMYKDHLINIIDTPGHADFGGQVERVLQMADGVLLLVDAAEGPMPQTYFVLKKALALHLKVVVVINKVDKPAARCDWVHDQVFDLMIKLEAPDDVLDFPLYYASAKNGFAMKHLGDPQESMEPLFDAIIEHIPAPKDQTSQATQMLISSLSYSSFLGRLATGRITAGVVKTNQDILVTTPELHQAGKSRKARISKIYHFMGNEMQTVEEASCGEIVAIAGIEDITVGETITDPSSPNPLPTIGIDPPTISMHFIPNDSPFSGQEGEFVTSRHIRERLMTETLSDVALKVEDLIESQGFKVSGRGELHLSVLIEKMRREGYEFQVTRPQVIFREEQGQRLEPYEELTIDVDDDYSGKVIESLGQRKGQLLEMTQQQGLTRMIYKIPTRGLLGFKSQFMTDTKGMGLMNYVFMEYGPYCGTIRNRNNGVLIAMENCTTNAYALFSLQDRGKMFLGPGDKIYEGQIIGENSRSEDLVVNPGKGKKLTNMRASGSDDNILLTPPINMSLEQCIAYINDDELVEITPQSIRLRKSILSEVERKRVQRKTK